MRDVTAAFDWRQEAVYLKDEIKRGKGREGADVSWWVLRVQTLVGRECL